MKGRYLDGALVPLGALACTLPCRGGAEEGPGLGCGHCDALGAGLHIVLAGSMLDAYWTGGGVSGRLEFGAGLELPSPQRRSRRRSPAVGSRWFHGRGRPQELHGRVPPDRSPGRISRGDGCGMGPIPPSRCGLGASGGAAALKCLPWWADGLTITRTSVPRDFRCALEEQPNSMHLQEALSQSLPRWRL